MKKKTKIAAIDIGTNSVLYSLFECDYQQHLHELHFERHTVRIGAGLKLRRKTQISRECYDRLLGVLNRLARHARRSGAARTFIAATNPLRIAKNGRVVKERLESNLNLPVAILSPDREAYLSYLGARGKIASVGRALVIDLGGGSTELAAFRGQERLAFVTIPEGAVALTERWLSSGPITPAAFSVFEKYLRRYDRRIEKMRPYLRHNVTLVGGTSSALAYMKDSAILETGRDVELTAEELYLLVNLLARLDTSGRRRLLGADKKRAEIIFAGAFWLHYLFKVLKLPKAWATHRGLRHGLVLDYLARS